ncbi:MAG: hypothetical protein SF162_20365 [bacterium]|nr:hypothetical protein [bacterium]
MHFSARNAALPLLMLVALWLSACESAAQQIVPTARPTATPTQTIAATRTPDENATATATLTLPPTTATFGPSPTPLLGPTRIAQAAEPNTPPTLNPNAPRIEFFTTDAAAVAPGSPVNLYWSSRNAVSANIYRVVNGTRNEVYQVATAGQLSVPTRRADRGSLEFLLSVGDGRLTTEQSLIIPLACPDTWFFQPAPDACPTAPAQETLIIEEPFERGRMVYIQAVDTVYALFNDGRSPMWIALPNRYDPAVDPESAAEFQPPPGFYQPLRILGFVWRGNDTVRNRLGLAVNPEFTFNGFFQAARQGDDETIYATGADGVVLQLLPEGALWQIITPP